MSVLDDITATSETLDRVLAQLGHRDRRKACPRPCPAKKANKGRKGPKHVCELEPGDGMTPMERMRNASPAQIQAQRYDRPGGRGSGKSDPTGRIAETIMAQGQDDASKLRATFARAARDLAAAHRTARNGVPAKRTPEYRQLAQQAKSARDAAHLCDLIVMRWGPPHAPTQADRKRLAQSNTTAPPDCQCCTGPVLMVGSAALETDAGGNLPTKGPTCDWCVSIARRTGEAPTKKMINDHRAGRTVRLPAPGHVEAT